MDKLFQLLLIFFICAMVIVGYGTFRCNSTNFKDPLTQAIAPAPFDSFLDGWGISHFIFYGVLTFFYPDPRSMIFIWTIGVLWEIVESIFSDHPFYLSSCKYDMQTDLNNNMGKNNGSGWWYGRWQDIVMNSTGMLMGYTIAQTLNAK